MPVIVLGSINIDLVTRTPRHPKIGETLLGGQFGTTPGGKGANQAVACARLGADTHMIGCVGDDVFAPALLDSLRAYGVNVDHVERVAGISSGTASITVDAKGDNTILVVPGANEYVGARALESLRRLLTRDSVLLLQLEVPLDTVVRAAAIAHDAGAIVILDPAPAQELPESLYRDVDFLTPNQSEAGLLCQLTVNTPRDASVVARTFQRLGVRYPIVKLGGDGLVYADEEQVHRLSAFPVEVVDTVAAGDAFNGGLAAGLCGGLTLEESLTWARAAGALCVTRRGAQVAMPTREELHDFLLERTQG